MKTKLMIPLLPATRMAAVGCETPAAGDTGIGTSTGVAQTLNGHACRIFPVSEVRKGFLNDTTTALEIISQTERLLGDT